MYPVWMDVSKDGWRVRDHLTASPDHCCISTKLAHIKEGHDVRLDFRTSSNDQYSSACDRDKSYSTFSLAPFIKNRDWLFVYKSSILYFLCTLISTKRKLPVSSFSLSTLPTECFSACNVWDFLSHTKQFSNSLQTPVGSYYSTDTVHPELVSDLTG